MGVSGKRDSSGQATCGHIPKLQELLNCRADPRTRTWWESYLKGVIPFRGVRMAEIRALLHGWIRDNGIGELAAGKQRDLALQLIRQTCAEDKLAGILFLQEVLIPSSHIHYRRDIARFGRLFSEGHIFDWNTCDWFCVKVLGPLADRDGEPCARAIARWKNSRSLWQRRAAGVAFVNLAARGDHFFPGFTQMLLQVCERTVQCPERFAQTGTGWVLRELSVAEPQVVAGFVETNLPRFSREGLRYAVEKYPAPARKRLLAKGKH